MPLSERDYMRNAPRWHAGEVGSSLSAAEMHAAVRRYNRRRRWRMIRRFFTVLIVLVGIVVGFGILATWANGGFTAGSPSGTQQQPASTTNSPGAGWGVHVCKAPHYNASGVVCMIDDRQMPSWRFPKAELAFTGVNGASFPSTSITILISQQNANGAFISQGQTTVTGSLADALESALLADVFNSANVTPQIGATYRIEVDAGSTLLGTTTFTYVR